MENIIEKLNQIENRKNIWKNWSLEEIKQLLNIYFTISKKEAYIFELIYSYHGTDSWEDIFRDYDAKYLDDKTTGVEVAIDEVERIIEENSA